MTKDYSSFQQYALADEFHLAKVLRAHYTPEKSKIKLFRFADTLKPYVRTSCFHSPRFDDRLSCNVQHQATRYRPYEPC